MKSDMEHVLGDALALPDSDRVELVAAILASLHPNDRPPFDESWRAVIVRRSEELRTGQVTPIPWDDVRASAGRLVAEPLFHPEATIEYIKAVGWYRERALVRRKDLKPRWSVHCR